MSGMRSSVGSIAGIDLGDEVVEVDVGAGTPPMSRNAASWPLTSPTEAAAIIAANAERSTGLSRPTMP